MSVGEERILLRRRRMKEHQNTELKANLGIVLRGEIDALKGFVERLDGMISETPDVQLVHKHVSASKLWVKEGGEMNEAPRDD